MRNVFLLILLFCFCFTSFSQEYLLDVENFTAEDGMANMHTYSTFKDSKGYLWLSTKYGLNRYDGYDFKLFTHEKNGLSRNDLILRMEEDAEGNLWLFYMQPGSEHTIGGIDVFDPISEKATSLQEYIPEDLPFKFQTIFHNSVKVNHEKIWIYNSEGQLFFYKKKKFEKLFESPGQAIRTIIETEDGVLVGSGNELIRLDMEGQILEKHELPDPVHQIWKTETAIWLLTIDSFKFSPIYHTLNYTVWRKTEEVSDFEVFLFKDNDLLKKRQGNYLYRDQNGLWYLSGEKSDNRIPKIIVFNPAGEKIFDLGEAIDAGASIQSNSILETPESLWMTSGVGMLQVKVTKNPFRIIHTRKELSDTRGITEDELGNIYFLNGPIFQYSPLDGNVQKLTTKAGTYSLIYRDSLLHANLYASRFSMLNYDFKTKTENYSPKWKGYTPICCSLETEKTGVYLVGCIKGLSYFDYNKNTGQIFRKYNEFEELKNLSIYYLHENELGIWLATEKGIYLIKKGEGVVRRYNKESGDLPFNHIKHISANPEGGFWLATSGGGIIHWQPSSDISKASEFRQFTTADGLSNDYTYAVYPDEYGSLWIPSDLGLMQMNASDFSVKTYLTEDGLPHNEFNASSHFRAKDGTLYFGGLGGLISFHPKDFSIKEKFNAPIHFTGFHLWEEGKETITDKTASLQTGEAIRIRPGDKLFELKFALLDFDKVENHSYSYTIEGYDERPNFIKENFLRITNLPYGDYNLKIKGQNITKGWSEQELNIPIHVLKPFYLQLWFVGLMFFGGIGLVIAYITRRENRLKKERERLEIEVINRTKTIQEQTEKLKELDKAKTRFFSNITHELRTPLTLILGPSQQLAQNNVLPIPERRKLWNISKNAEHLLSLINQMLDLSKLEDGQMRVEISKGELVSYIQDLTDAFTSMAEKKQILLNFKSSETHWETNFDKGKLNKIIFNLLSNAIKFTPKGGEVNVFLEKQENTILIKIEDTGVGIKPEELNRIFNRFYQTDDSSTRSKEGTGIGLSLVKELVNLLEGDIKTTSKYGVGTQFIVKLPILELNQTESDSDNHSTNQSMVFADSLVKIPEVKTNSTISESYSEKLDLLIIEDNEGIHEYLHSCLDTEKYNIITAFDGEEGIQKAFDLVPDLIISDIMMPKKDGFDVTSAIRNNISTSHIPLILLTAKSSLESRLQGLQRGADAYLTKPFSPRELVLRIDKLIELRQILQSRYGSGTQLIKNKIFRKEDVFVRKVRAYILENIEEVNLNGDVIGKHIGITRMHLYRKLKALTGKSISEIIKEVRLKKAMELLSDKSNDLNITEVSYKTGFSSISYFSRSFKEAYDKSPSEV